MILTQRQTADLVARVVTAAHPQRIILFGSSARGEADKHGDIDLLVNRRVQVGCFPWRFVDGEASISRIVAMVDDDEYAELMKKKDSMPKTRFGDCYDPVHVERLGGRGAAY